MSSRSSGDGRGDANNGAGQLTRADWERMQAADAERQDEPSARASAAPAETGGEVALLAAALAPQVAAALAMGRPGAPASEASTARLLTLDELVAELPSAKRPQTWKRWLYERTRRGEIPGCVKLGGMLFFEREPALAWLRAGAITR